MKFRKLAAFSAIVLLISAASLLAATIVTDNFQRIAGNLGPNWTNFINGYTANNNAQGTTAGSTLNIATYTAIAFTSDQVSTATIQALNGATDFLGPAVRVQGTAGVTANQYVATENNNALAIQRTTGVTPIAFGTTVTLGSLSTTGNNGDTLTLTMVGNTLTLDKNTTKDILQVTDTTFIGGAPGISQFGNVATFASFSATSMAAPGGTLLNVVCVGDSITYGFGVTTPWSQSLSLTQSPSSVSNLGIPNQGIGLALAAKTAGTINSMISMISTSLAPLFVPTARNVVVIWGGSNDIVNGGGTPAQAYADAKTYAAAAKAFGFRVVLVPALSRNPNDSDMQTLDALYTADHSFVDALVVLPASLVANGAFANTTFFIDSIHPTQFSDTTIIAPAVSAAINGVTGGGSLNVGRTKTVGPTRRN